MKPALRRILLFAGAFVPLFVVLVLLYPKVVPVYQRVAVAVANSILAGMDPPFRISLDAEGGWIASLLLPDGSSERFYGAGASDRHLLYMNLVLLPPLLLASPARVVPRLVRLGLGLILLFAFHVTAEVAMVRSALCLDVDPANVFCAWTVANLAVSGQLFAVLLWALLTWSHWLPRSDTPVPVRAAPGTPRNARCPCGSGRKYKHCCLP